MKKNNFKLKFIILITTCIALSFEYRLNSSDLCNSIEGCTSTNYRYACGEEYCAAGKISCESFIIWSVIASQSNKDIYSTYQAQIYKRFKDSVKPCPEKKYELSPSDVCARTKQCRNKMHLFNFRFDACPCRNHFRHSCGSGNFCTVNKKTCDGLMVQIKNNKSDDILKRIDPC